VVTVALPDDLAARLREAASARGEDIDTVATKLLTKALDDIASDALAAPGRRRMSFIAIGASSGGSRAADVDGALADGFGRD
jgi:hypothetical protein